MNPEIKKQWVAALRSGEYRKGTAQLRDGNDRYCCLGVLCELAVKANVTQRVRTGYRDFASRDGVENSLLTLAVMVWAGITTSSPNVNYAGENFSLADLNDNQGASFATIADYIEESPL